MLTPEEFVKMKEYNRILIETVFQQEDSFKESMISPRCRYNQKEYEINRVHNSGHRMRVELQFDDMSTADVYFDLEEVYSWYENENRKLNQSKAPSYKIVTTPYEGDTAKVEAFCKREGIDFDIESSYEEQYSMEFFTFVFKTKEDYNKADEFFMNC